MESRPEMKHTVQRVSTYVIGILGVIQVAAGVVLFFSPDALPREMRSMAHIIAIGLVLSSAVLFVFVNVTSDIRRQTDIQEYNAQETAYYHTQAMKMLQNIEMMMQQQNYRQPAPYFVDMNAQQERYEQPQGMQQSTDMYQGVESDKNYEGVEKVTQRRNENNYMPEDEEYKYRAQFMPPKSDKSLFPSNRGK